MNTLRINLIIDEFADQALFNFLKDKPPRRRATFIRHLANEQLLLNHRNKNTLLLVEESPTNNHSEILVENLNLPIEIEANNITEIGSAGYNSKTSENKSEVLNQWLGSFN